MNYDSPFCLPIFLTSWHLKSTLHTFRILELTASQRIRVGMTLEGTLLASQCSQWSFTQHSSKCWILDLTLNWQKMFLFGKSSCMNSTNSLKISIQKIILNWNYCYFYPLIIMVGRSSVVTVHSGQAMGSQETPAPKMVGHLFSVITLVCHILPALGHPSLC